MFGARPPQNQPPHPPQNRQPHPPQNQPPHPPQGESVNLPALTEHDHQLLRQLLSNEEQAQAMFGMLQNSPPEIAALGYLMLRVLENNRST